MPDEESGALIKLDRQLVGLGYGERDGCEAGADEVMDAVLKQQYAQAQLAIAGGYTKLRNMSDVAADTGA